MTLADFKDIATITGAIGTLIVAYFAYRVYRKNSNLERAKWLESLYEKFYEEDRLKTVREIIDSDDEYSRKKVDHFLENEPPEFTDYLNFFEFVAILEKNNQLTIEEVRDLFSYYLKSLHKWEKIREYINRKENGFGKLRALLGKMFPKEK